ncbi:hypothetical protein Q3G72_009122 [Acer saccharum]|nr:hypothetical protein Q3G72_009122 [Acer saccharum]
MASNPSPYPSLFEEDEQCRAIYCEALFIQRKHLQNLNQIYYLGWSCSYYKFTKSTTQSLTTQSASSSSPITIDSQTFERINKSVNSKFSQSHIIDKLRKLRAKYRKQARTRSLIKTSHNQEIFNIAHKMWGRKMKPKEKKVEDPISSDDNNFNEKAEVEEEEEAMVTGNG